jgi:ribonuclease Y
MDNIYIFIIGYIISGGIAGFLFKTLLAARNQKDEAEKTSSQIIELQRDMQGKIENKEKDIEKEKKRIRENFEHSTSRTREELKSQRQEIEAKTKDMDRKADVIESKEAEIRDREKNAQELEKRVAQMEQETQEIKDREVNELQRISRMTPKEAREQLMRRIEEEAQDEAQRSYKRIVENARRDAQREAVEIIAQAIQRNASDVTQEITVTSVPISDEEMKGRIIGREGRNIRALEAETGVNLIIDDTPGLITISSYDGVRRETAKRSLSVLMKDGRIQPARIEEVVAKVKKEVEEVIKKSGEEAAIETGVLGLHDDIIYLLGKLKFRTSYGQNVLEHSVSVANLAGIMAKELDIDADFARRAGLFHDIGKAVDRETQGNHADIGAKLAKKYGESDRLQNAILCHHQDAEPQSAEAILIQAADAISASRPGARHENLEYYIKRMTDIEEIAKNYEGVKDAYCLSAGRELRVIVEPSKVTDLDVSNIAKMCAKQIEERIDYPGEIKVTVIRNLRSTEMAK